MRRLQGIALTVFCLFNSFCFTIPTIERQLQLTSEKTASIRRFEKKIFMDPFERKLLRFESKQFRKIKYPRQHFYVLAINFFVIFLSATYLLLCSKFKFSPVLLFNVRPRSPPVLA